MVGTCSDMAPSLQEMRQLSVYLAPDALASLFLDAVDRVGQRRPAAVRHQPVIAVRVAAMARMARRVCVMATPLAGWSHWLADLDDSQRS
jgi:hypothetical protein